MEVSINFITANVPANLQICRSQPEPKSEGSVRVRHIDGFVRFEFYICFLYVSSSSVRFFPKCEFYFGSVLPKMWVLVRFGLGSIPISIHNVVTVRTGKVAGRCAMPYTPRWPV